MSERPITILCIASYFKGESFMIGAKKAGCRVLLLTTQKLQDKNWPHEFIDEKFYVPDETDDWDMKRLIKGLSYVMRSEKIDRIAALDDYDVEKAAYLREYFRISGMGQSRYRFFRDKLAMRMQAQEAGLAVPAFSALFNDHQINEFAQHTPTPWVVKPRSQASAVGIKKVYTSEQLWEIIHELGDERGEYLVEQFVPGDVFHVDALNYESKVVFARVHQYVNTPMDVVYDGGIFRSYTVAHDSKDDKALQKFNQQVMKAFGMKYSASHTEFIKAHADGKFYFLETSSRVGGANIAELLEASSGLNIWAEWAKIEAATVKGNYELPKVDHLYSGIIISLTRQEYPDTSAYTDAEICWRMSNKEHHVGFIFKSDSLERIKELLDSYAHRIKEDFHASMPVNPRPTN